VATGFAVLDSPMLVYTDLVGSARHDPDANK